jgi:hypothetical protein
MSWCVIIYFQERGTKKEARESVCFTTRDEAITALRKLEVDLKSAGADETIIVDSGGDRVSFIKQDYRRNSLSEITDGPIAFTSDY